MSSFAQNSTSYNDIITSKKGKVAILFGFTSLLVIVFYCTCIAVYSVNFPYDDDFGSIMDWLSLFRLSHGLADKVHLLFAQHNEHRILSVRVATIILYYATHHLNFLGFILIGNTGLLIIVYVLNKNLSHIPDAGVAFLLPVVLLVFNFTFHEVAFWAMASIQNIWVIAFALLSMYLYFKEGFISFSAALLFAFMATFSSTNGMIVFAAVFVTVLLQGKVFTGKMLVWLICMVLCIGGYFYQYSFIGNPDGHVSLAGLKLLVLMQYAFVFLGGCFSTNIQISLFWGIILAAILALATVKGVYKQYPVLYSLTIFIFLTAFLVALGRSRSGISQALASRYAVNSSLFAASCLLIVIVCFSRTLNVYFYLAIFLACAFFNLNSTRKYLIYRIGMKKIFDREYERVTSNQISNFTYGWPFADKTIPKRILNEANQAGIFEFKSTDELILLKHLKEGKLDSLEFNLNGFTGFDQAGWGYISGWSLVRHVNADSIVNLILLEDSTGKISKLIVPQRYNKAEIAAKYKGDKIDYTHCGFGAIIRKIDLEPGRYKIVFLICNSEIVERIDKGEYLDV